MNKLCAIINVCQSWTQSTTCHKSKTWLIQSMRQETCHKKTQSINESREKAAAI